MSVLERIAHFKGRRDEVPNQELARELAEAEDKEGIQEIAENLWHKNTNVQSDCIKVLYEIGYLKPDLIAAYGNDFVKLLSSKQNRLVWGAMIALSTIAALAADELFPQREKIIKAMDKGSVITVDGGVMALAGIASKNPEYNNEIFPYLLNHLKTCRPKDVPQHSEKTMISVNADNKEAFIAVLEKRLEDMSPSQAARIKKVIKQAGSR
ncbi:MAG: hypothetical protein JW908_07340 [Anaerolineales bacterium]|nr:hypothetical protein [Anaerolineales bacterium]